MIPRSFLVLSLLAAPVCVGAAPPAPVVFTPSAKTVTVSASLSKTSFKADEPIDLVVTLSNTSDKEVHVGGSAFEISSFDLDLRDQNGQKVKRTPEGEHILAMPTAVFRNISLLLPPKGQRSHTFPVSQMFDLSPGGRFSLTVSRRFIIGYMPIGNNEYTDKTVAVSAEPLEFSVEAAPAAVAPSAARLPITISASLAKSSFKVAEAVNVTLTYSNPNDVPVQVSPDAFGKPLFSINEDLRDERDQKVKRTLTGERELEPHTSIFLPIKPLLIPPKGQLSTTYPLSLMFDLSGGGQFTFIVSYTSNGSTVQSAPLQFFVEPAQAAIVDADAPVALAPGQKLQARLQHDINLSDELLLLEVQVAVPTTVRVEVMQAKYSGHPEWPQDFEPVPLREAGRRVLPLQINHSARLDLARAFDLTASGKFLVRVSAPGCAPVELTFLR